MERLRRTRLGLALAGVLVAVVAGVGFIALRGDDGDGRCRLGGDTPSVARVWNELALSAIRRDIPAPTVHSRNLFHLSAAMWDTWVAFDDTSGATPLYVDIEGVDADDVAQARLDAIAYAGHRLLTARYRAAEGEDETIAELDAALTELCGSVASDALDPEEPAALGIRIADAVLAATADDGALEADGYVDPEYRPVNPSLDPSEPGTVMDDPNRWQPLRLETAVSQNGLPMLAGPQEFIGSQWGHVEAFALPAADERGLTIDPGPPPFLGGETDLAFREAMLDVVAAGDALETGRTTVDISPGVFGANPLGTDDGVGHGPNPVTGEPYEANVVDLGDYGRVVAEYWADGPDSETPPGHWNVIANEVSDRLRSDEHRLGGRGEPLDRLEWDVKLYLSLNGAMHDAAIAAWGTKAHYDYTRPISMIRYTGGLGQSSDQGLPSYDPQGLLLQPGLVEVITADTAAAGERHQHLVDHVGEIAVRGWRGSPDDPETEIGGVGWVRAVEWVPYQRPTFVTPAFAGYVSGHSTFSRAGAEVLAAFTGSPAFPGGLETWTIEVGELLHEEGPTAPVTLQWATYADAADEAGRSRIYGGIHVPADDYAGRIMGAEIGVLAYERAVSLF